MKKANRQGREISSSIPSMKNDGGFVHHHLHTDYSFLDGASDIETLVRCAAQHGMTALAVTDHNSLTAAIKFNACCQQYAIRPIFGAELTLEDQSHLTLLAASRVGYGNICRMLSLAYCTGGRLTPALPWADVEPHTEGVICLTGCRKGKLSRLILQRRYREALEAAQQLHRWFGARLYVELQIDHTPKSATLARHLVQLAGHIHAPVVATNNVHYAAAEEWVMHDIKRCIAHGITIADHHPERPINHERYLKSAGEMGELFAWCPEAVANTLRIAEICASDGIMPRDEEITPPYPTPNGQSEAAHLREVAYAGARRRYGRIDAPIRKRLDEEIALLDTLGYAGFVMHAARIVAWAREQNIRTTGRGSGADSIVCYALGLTDIDVIPRNLPVARWLAPGKKPDIDIDFDARHRDDVFRYIARTYGEEHTALCCTYATYHAKGALRDVGKVLALPPEVLSWFTKHIDAWMPADEIHAAFTRNAELRRYAALAERFALLFKLCGKLAGQPRHIGSHSSGVVISRIPLSTLNVVTPSARGVLPIIMLDKDDVEEATIDGRGVAKLDILSLPILGVTTDAERNIQRSDPQFNYADIPREDPETYRMLWTGSGNLGLFQLGSPAQAALATQLHPRDFEDLVASVGLIRPGPIKARAVQKYCAARNGYARIAFLHPALAPVLERTYGVCCFQEQVSGIISVMLGLSDADAEVWRKRLAKHARFNTMAQAREDFVSRARARHADLLPKVAHRIMDELEGWSSLGFVEGHSASFALTGQKTAYMLRHHPAHYYAALLSNQPCGFYAPQSVASEARRRGAQILPLDINASEKACISDAAGASIRIGFCLVSGIREEDIAAILAARDMGRFAGLLDFCVRVPLRRDLVENLILCGAFDLLHDHRRGLLWRLDETLAKALALRAEIADPALRLPGLRVPGADATPIAWDIADFTPWDKLLWEWRVVGVTTSCHPFAYLRDGLGERGILTCHEAMQRKAGVRVTIAGLNLRPHRPPSKSGGRHLFTTFEDETAYVQAAFYGRAVEACLPTILLSPVVIARAVVKRVGLGASLEVEQVWPLRVGQFMARLSSTARLSADGFRLRSSATDR